MSRTLSGIPEIIRLIIGILDDDRDLSNYGLRPIYYMSLASRAFHQIALDALWRVQQGVDNLVRCLPRDLYTMNPKFHRDNESPLYKFARPPSARDWIRFNIYAARVKELDCLARMPSLECLDYLGLFRPSMFLLPNLRKLLWVERGRNPKGYVYLFLGPSLRELHFGFSLEMTAGPLASIASTILSRVQASCPSLEKLHLGLREAPSVDPQIKLVAVDELLCSLSGLKDYSGDVTLSTPTVCHLAASFLERIEIRLYLGPDLLNQLSSTRAVSGPLFPAVKVLFLDCSGAVEHIESLLCLLLDNVPLLTDLGLSTNEDVPRDTLTRWLDLISHRGKRTPHLHGLRFNLTAIPIDDDDDDSLVDITALQPILAMSQLRRLCFESTFLSLDSAAIATIGSALPHLQELILLPTVYNSHVRFTTLGGLTPLLRACPDLEVLEMPFDAERPSTSIVDVPIFHSSMKKIGIGCSPVPYGDAPTVALCLASLFSNPNLEMVDTCSRPVNFSFQTSWLTGASQWQRVREFFAVIVLAKTQEKKRILGY